VSNLAPSRRKLILAPKEGSRILGHAPALDGLRGIAVALIVAFHFAGHSVIAGHRVLHGATASLDVFFALSGFLITALILDERRSSGRVDMRAFYVRRACRLLPALLTMLVVWCGLLAAFHNQPWMRAVPAGDGTGSAVPVVPALKDVGLALLYCANWDVVSGGMTAPLQHLWSLAVEEQFYIVWPGLLLGLLLLQRLGHRKLALGLVAAGIGASLATSIGLWFHGADSDRLYFGTDTRAASLLVGSLAALVWHRRRALGRQTRLPAARAWCGVAVFVAILVLVGENVWKYTVLPAVIAVAVSQVMPYVVDAPRTLLSRALSLSWLVWLGQRSYGLYLWHYLWATWTHGLGLALGLPLGIAGSLLCTVLSWQYVEQPALAWGRARLRRVPVPHPAYAHTRAVPVPASASG
jgi:peptidoglycan/LPS O-acetylase OafA/YrhL